MDLGLAYQVVESLQAAGTACLVGASLPDQESQMAGLAKAAHQAGSR